MIEQVKKIIRYQVNTGQSEASVCSEIGITTRTLYNARKGVHKSDNTINKINIFIEEKGL